MRKSIRSRSTILVATATAVLAIAVLSSAQDAGTRRPPRRAAPCTCCPEDASASERRSHHCCGVCESQLGLEGGEVSAIPQGVADAGVARSSEAPIPAIIVSRLSCGNRSYEARLRRWFVTQQSVMARCLVPTASSDAGTPAGNASFRLTIGQPGDLHPSAARGDNGLSAELATCLARTFEHRWAPPHPQITEPVACEVTLEMGMHRHQ